MDKTAFARAERINQRRASFATYTTEYLLRGAKELGVDLVGDETREEIEFAVAEADVNGEDAALAAEASEKAAAEAREKREAYYQTKEGKRQRAIDERDARDHAVRKVNAGFCSALPTSARMQGTYQPDPAGTGGDHPVPDGRYRVSGSHWVLSFKDNKWTSADMAHARTEPDWIEIADTPGGAVSAKSPASEKF
jgi:hypothetical protein